MGKSLEPIMTRTIRINADYLSETTIAKYINPVVSGEGTIELPPVVSIPGIISYFSQDNSVMLKMTKDLTLLTTLTDVTELTSEGFIKAIRENLEAMM